MRPNLLPRLRLSISTRLTLWYGVSLLILLSVFVIFLYASFHVSLHRDFDEQLQREKQLLRPAVDVSSGEPSLTPSERLRAVAYQTDGIHGTFVRVLSPEGRVRYSSPNFAGHEGFAPSVPATGRETTWNHAWEEAPARTLYSPIPAPEGGLAGWLEITRLESTLHRELHRLGWLLGIGIVAGLIVSVGSGYGLARRALHPVAALTDAANRLRPADLGARLPTAFGVRDELTDLADTFNALLERLQASFERERRFRADAAHEMFTPLSAVQSEVEVALRKPRDPAAYRAALERIGTHTRRMAAVLDGLLELSRAEALEPAAGGAIDLSAVAAARLEQAAARAEAAQIVLRHEIEPGVVVAAEADHLEKVLDNLLDNALKYTPAGGTVRVSVCAEAAWGVLRVADTGIGIDAEDRQHLFDRFFRSERGEVQQARGGGLGLSIARAIVGAYGGTIDAESTGPARGSTFTVRFRSAH